MAIPEAGPTLTDSAGNASTTTKSSAMASSNPDIWSKFFTRCLAKRVKKEQFEELALELFYHAPFTGRRIVDGLFGFYQAPPLFIDPLIMLYLEALLDSSRVSCADLLSALFDRSRYCPTAPTDDKESKETSRALGSLTAMEHLVIDLVSRSIYSTKRPSSTEEARAILRATAKWASALSNAANVVLHAMDTHYGLICDSVGLLAIACFENVRMIELIDHRLSKGKPAPASSNY
jgi:hypothetical protein